MAADVDVGCGGGGEERVAVGMRVKDGMRIVPLIDETPGVMLNPDAASLFDLLMVRCRVVPSSGSLV